MKKKKRKELCGCLEKDYAIEVNRQCKGPEAGAWLYILIREEPRTGCPE